MQRSGIDTIKYPLLTFIITFLSKLDKYANGDMVGTVYHAQAQVVGIFTFNSGIKMKFPIIYAVSVLQAVKIG